MEENPYPDKYIVELLFFDRETDQLVAKEEVRAPAQGTLVFKIWKKAMEYGSKRHYLVVKTTRCQKRPAYVIRQLRQRGIHVEEPEEYPNGEKSKQKDW